MPEDQPSATTGHADPTTTPEATHAEGASPGTLKDPPPSGAADAVDDLYDKAFDQFLSPTAPETPAANQGEESDTSGGESAQQQQSDADSAPKLEDNDVQLLKRLHMTPEMIAGWSPAQQREFLTNAAKREADQTRTFKDLSERLKKIEDGDPGAGNPGKGEAGKETPSSDTSGGSGGGSFAEDAQKVVDDAANVFGEEIKPLGELTLKLGQTLDQVAERLNRAEQTSSMKDGLIVEMTIDSGIRDLVDDYPSLNKADARQRVVDRFKQDWANPENPHRKGQGSILQRVRAAIADAAKAEFGNTTESAAQVALHNQTKQRLKNQPEAGSGKGRKAPVTEDDVYDQAFEEHLKPELK